MSKTIKCPTCNGMKKIVAMKSGKATLAICKGCKGKGKIDSAPVKSTAKKATVKKKVVAKLTRKVKADKSVKEVADKPSAAKGKVIVMSRDLESGKDVSSKLTPEQADAKETIEDRAAYFGCPGKVIAVRKGPVITLYEFAPAKTTRIKRLINLQEDLALALSAEAVMVRRIPGREVMGIEISNESHERQNVGFRASLQSIKDAKARGMELPLNLGTDPFGEPIIDDLAALPHLLIAGSTGSGKSVSLNCIISSLLTVCSPEELQFYMIDPKGVELGHYNGIPHMKQKMVTSPHYAKDLLETLISEMRMRMSLLASKGVRDIKEYNELAKINGTPRFSRIVCVVDELGDLMMQDRREFTRLIAEISQIARASGIHMICATQRPSVDVLSGRIKVNFPGRMAFKVTSMTDSKVILHRKGAEGLLGRGDMLYLSPTRATTIRIHAPWVPLTDVKVIADKLREMEAKRLEEERNARMAEERKREEARQAAQKKLGQQEREAIAPRIVGGDESALPINFGWGDITNKK